MDQFRDQASELQGGRGLAGFHGASFHSPLACAGHCADLPISAAPLSRVGYGTHLCSSCTQPQSAPVPQPAPRASAGPARGLLGLCCGGTLTSISQVRTPQSVKFSICPVTEAKSRKVQCPACCMPVPTVPACARVYMGVHSRTLTYKHTSQPGLFRECTLGFVQCTDGGLYRGADGTVRETKLLSRKAKPRIRLREASSG